jgi:lipopolysaccharide/colanic/teichoic acid biosynthesis glycosyltransferase
VKQKRRKRWFDIITALLCLPPALLIIAVAGAVIWLSNPRAPVVFRQQRTGLDGTSFTIYKLRTMRHPPEPFRPCDSLKDPRITRIGYWLRRFKLDELPQLFNVLQGSMSIVGPRPYEYTMDAGFAAELPDYKQRWSVKPGLTGPGKLWARGDPLEEIRLDLEYATTSFTWRHDARLVRRTVIFAVRGA